MKRMIAVLLVLSMLFVLTACNPDKTDTSLPSDNADVQNTDNTSAKDDEPEKKWGVTESLTVKNNGTLCDIYVNFADYVAPTHATGKMTEQKDGSIMIFDGQGILTTIQIPSGKVEDIFPAYFSQTEAIMASAHISKRKDFKFTIESKETVTINGYEMCKVTGVHTYSPFLEDKVISQKFVAYATFTKGNGAVANWMVLDGTADGSLGNKLEDIGRKMAESFREAQ